MSVKPLKVICLLKISRTLTVQYIICRKKKYKIPIKISEEIFKYYSTNNKYLHENDLKFFKTKVCCLKDVCLTSYQMKYVRDYEFLIGHQFDNLTILGILMFPLRNCGSKILTKNLRIELNDNEKYEKCCLFIYLSIHVKKSISIKGKFINGKLLPSFYSIFENSSKHLKEINLSIEMLNDTLENILKVIRRKKNLQIITIKNLQKFNDLNQISVCQSCMIMKSLSNSFRSIETLKLDKTFCIQHTTNFLQQLTSLKRLTLQCELINNKFSIDTFRKLAKHHSKSLKEIHVHITHGCKLLGSFCDFLENLDKLEVFTCKFDDYWGFSNLERLFLSLKSSSGTLKKIFIQPYISYDKYVYYKLLLKECCSLENVEINDDDYEDEESLLDVFKNSMTSLRKVSFCVSTLSIEKSMDMAKFLKELKNLKTLKLCLSYERFLKSESIFNVFKNSSTKLECIDLSGCFLELDDEDTSSLITLIESCYRLRKFTIDIKSIGNESFENLIMNLMKFSYCLEKLCFKIFEFNEHQLKFIGKLLEECLSLKKFYIRTEICLQELILKHFVKGLKSSAISLNTISITGFRMRKQLFFNLVEHLKFYPSLKEVELGTAVGRHIAYSPEFVITKLIPFRFLFRVILSV